MRIQRDTEYFVHSKFKMKSEREKKCEMMSFAASQQSTSCDVKLKTMLETQKRDRRRAFLSEERESIFFSLFKDSNYVRWYSLATYNIEHALDRTEFHNYNSFTQFFLIG